MAVWATANLAIRATVANHDRPYKICKNNIDEEIPCTSSIIWKVEQNDGLSRDISATVTNNSAFAFQNCQTTVGDSFFGPQSFPLASHGSRTTSASKAAINADADDIHVKCGLTWEDVGRITQTPVDHLRATFPANSPEGNALPTRWSFAKEGRSGASVWLQGQRYQSGQAPVGTSAGVEAVQLITRATVDFREARQRAEELLAHLSDQIDARTTKHLTGAIELMRNAESNFNALTSKSPSSRSFIGSSSDDGAQIDTRLTSTFNTGVVSDGIPGSPKAYTYQELSSIAHSFSSLMVFVTAYCSVAQSIPALAPVRREFQEQIEMAKDYQVNFESAAQRFTSEAERVNRVH